MRSHLKMQDGRKDRPAQKTALYRENYFTRTSFMMRPETFQS